MDKFRSKNTMTQDIKALTSNLLSNNGMAGLELLSPSEIDRATRIFYRDGFVVIRDVLTPEQVHFLRSGCEREANEIIAIRISPTTILLTFFIMSLLGLLSSSTLWQSLLEIR